MADQHPSNNNSTNGAPSPKEPINWNRQIIVWVLVVIVVMIFGVGNTTLIPILQGRQKIMGGVDDHDAMARMDVSRRIQAALYPYNNRPDDMRIIAQKVVFARMADSEGLMPKGAALDKLVQDFLNEPLMTDPNRRAADALEDRKGSVNEVTLAELRRFVAEQYAFKAILARNVSAPAVPAAAANAAFAAACSKYDPKWPSEKIKADEVIITAKPLLSEIADDDADIQSTYDKLRATRFAIPAVAVLSVVHPDREALAKAAPISDDAIKKYYDDHKVDYRIPIDIDDAKEMEGKPPQYKELSAATPEIRKILGEQSADASAKDQMIAFEQALRDRDIEGDEAALKQAAKDANLAVDDGVEVKEDKDGKLIVGNIGELKQREKDVGLFSQPIGFVSGLTQTVGEEPKFLLFRLSARREAGSKDLSDADVKKVVKEHLVGERAYKQLLADAETIRAEAAKAGKGGLRAYFTADENKKKWNARVTTHTYAPLDELKPPADEQGIVSGEGKLAASLALPSSPVILANSEKPNDNIPSLKLVQVADIQPGDALKDDQGKQLAEIYREAIESHRRRLYNDEISQKFNN